MIVGQRAWTDFVAVRDAISSGKVLLTGNRQLGEDMQVWLKLSPFAHEKKTLAAA